MLDDGIYGLSFAASASGAAGAEDARGEALAILRGGTILGSDRFGGVFRGSYRYDAPSGAAVVDLRLAVPPNGVLVTGYEAGPDGASLDIRASFAPDRPIASTVVDVAGQPVAVALRYMGALCR
jgi:hypothetical protein